ncbi:MAG: glycosyltransferase family 4 protein [Actinomycetota bacterium]
MRLAVVCADLLGDMPSAASWAARHLIPVWADTQDVVALCAPGSGPIPKGCGAEILPLRPPIPSLDPSGLPCPPLPVLASPRTATSDEAEAALEILGGPVLHGMEEALQDARPDAVVLFGGDRWTTVAGARAASGKAILCPFARYSPLLELPAFIAVYASAREVIFGSVAERNLVHDLLGNTLVPYEIIPPGVEVPSASASGLVDLGRPYLAAVPGLGEEQLGPELCARFLSYAGRTGSALRLVLSGATRFEFPSDPRVVHLGPLDPDARTALYREALAVVDPAPFRSSPLALYRALACRTPVLVDARCDVGVGVCRDTQGGLWCATRDDFEEALSWLEVDATRARALGARGAEAVAEHHSWSAVARQYLAFFARVL